MASYFWENPLPNLHKEGHVRIEYGIVPNQREGYGWLPVLWVNGRFSGSTYASHGYDKDEAWVVSKQEAQEEADRFVGDWDVTITKRTKN